MIVTPENIFPGAKITKGIEPLTVVKVNAKSFYATKLSFSEFSDKYNSRLPGTTFVKFCKLNDIVSYKYSNDFHIEESESARREIAVENTKSSNAYKISKVEKKTLMEFVESFRKKKRSFRLMSVYCGRNIRILEERDNSFLLNIDGDYVLYSAETDECIKISTVYDYAYKTIPWEKLSCFAEEKVEAIA